MQITRTTLPSAGTTPPRRITMASKALAEWQSNQPQRPPLVDVRPGMCFKLPPVLITQEQLRGSNNSTVREAMRTFGSSSPSYIQFVKASQAEYQRLFRELKRLERDITVLDGKLSKKVGLITRLLRDWFNLDDDYRRNQSELLKMVNASLSKQLLMNHSREEFDEQCAQTATADVHIVQFMASLEGSQSYKLPPGFRYSPPPKTTQYLQTGSFMPDRVNYPSFTLSHYQHRNDDPRSPVTGYYLTPTAVVTSMAKADEYMRYINNTNTPGGLELAMVDGQPLARGEDVLSIGYGDRPWPDPTPREVLIPWSDERIDESQEQSIAKTLEYMGKPEPTGDEIVQRAIEVLEIQNKGADFDRPKRQPETRPLTPQEVQDLKDIIDFLSRDQ